MLSPISRPTVDNVPHDDNSTRARNLDFVNIFSDVLLSEFICIMLTWSLAFEEISPCLVAGVKNGSTFRSKHFVYYLNTNFSNTCTALLKNYIKISKLVTGSN